MGCCVVDDDVVVCLLREELHRPPGNIFFESWCFNDFLCENWQALETDV